MFKNKFLFYPVILFLFLFLFDKIFSIKSIKPYIKSDLTYIYYETKEELFDLMIQQRSNSKPDKKLMIILGSSRLLYFDYKELKEFYPNWDIYNFSSAVTTPAYYYYFLEKILNSNIKPDLIVLETDANQFNKNSPVFKNSNLTYSFNLSFILRYAFIFGKENVSFYLGKALFAVSKNKPYLDVALKRLKDPNHAALLTITNSTKQFLLDNNGNALSLIENYYEKDFSILDATSQRTLDWVYNNYTFSEMQFYFYEKILDSIKKENIPLLIVYPQTSIPMENKLKEKQFINNWRSKTQEITSKYQYEIKDMTSNSNYYCNSFADGGHISKDCYHPFMRFIMIEYFKDYIKLDKLIE